MAIYKVRARGKTRYRVRYRTPDSPNPKSKTFDKKADAESFESAVRSARDGAPTTFSQRRSDQTLGAFGLEYVKNFASVDLAPATLRNRRDIWNKHIQPRLGRYTLRTLEDQPDLIQAFKSDLLTDGVGPGAVRQSLAVLSAILGKAVEWNRITRNPALAVKKPSGVRVRPVEPFSPDQVEAVRHLLPNERDRLLVSVLAYAGVRPSEALALTGDDIRSRTILVSRALTDGEFGPTKTRRVRSVPLLKPLADDLKGCGPGLLFPRTDGKPWREHDLKNWRNRVWQPAMAASGHGTLQITGKGRTKRQTYEGPRPYDLRHSFVSLMLREDRNPIEVAEMTGNSPKVLLGTYAHVIADLRGADRVGAETLISTARRKTARVRNVSRSVAA